MTSTALNSDSAILAVDDDRDDLELLRLLLRKAGLPNPIQAFREGEQLRKSLGKWMQRSLDALQPLLCFLDIRMAAENNGHDALQWIRAQPALDRLPVVMLSASEHPRDIQDAAQNGAQCYLTKYPQPAVLKDVVEDAGRFAAGSPAEECFRIPANLLLVRCRRLNPAPLVAKPGLPALAYPPRPMPGVDGRMLR